MKKLLSKGFIKGIRKVVVVFLAVLMSVSSVGMGTIQSRAEETSDSSNNYGLRNPRVECIYRDTVTFGHYWQASTSNEKQPIEWQILERYQDGTALVMSDKVLDVKKYNDIDESTSWKDCSLRKWLNGNNEGDFKKEAFSNEEQTAIITSTIDNANNDIDEKIMDDIFILSCDEMENAKLGFPSNNNSNELRAYDTSAFAMKKTSYAYQWLRSTGAFSNYAAETTFYGYIFSYGTNVSGIAGVRPALRINLNSSYVSNEKKKVVSIKGSKWDTIKFGNYNGKDIVWRVLDINENDAFLLSDEIIDSKKVNEESTTESWGNCILREWLNNDFYNASFSNEEKSMIKTVAVENNGNINYGTEGEDLTYDKIYLLSLEEVTTPSYGFSNKYNFDSDTRRLASNNGESWWLRSPGHSSGVFSVVESTGNIYFYGVFNDSIEGVRPCLHIDLSKSEWEKGESVSVGNVTEEEKPSEENNNPTNNQDDINNTSQSGSSGSSSGQQNNNGNTGKTDTPSNPSSNHSSPTQSSNGVAKKSQNITGVKNIIKTYSTKKFSLKAVTDGNGKLTYVSSNKKVATVSADGKVKLIGAGKTKITVKASGTSSYTPAEKTITLTVKRSKQKITSKVKTKSIVYSDKTFSLGTKVQGNAKVTYKSSNPKVLTVSSKGKVKLKGIGKATITIKTKQNSKYAAGTKKIVITVKAPKVKLLKCTALSDCRVKLTWSAYSAFDGYEIQFSRDSKFSDGYEPIDFNKKSCSAILRGGAEGRTYYVRIRPYKKVNGKKVTYAWSNVSSFKTFK